MLPKKNRANKKTIDLIYKKGKTIFSPVLVLKYLKNTAPDKKISFLVSRAVARRAVKRNLLKRRGYVVLEKYFSKIPVGFYGVFVYGKDSLRFFGEKGKNRNLSIENLSKEIENLINKIY